MRVNERGEGERSLNEAGEGEGDGLKQEDAGPVVPLNGTGSENQ